MIADRWSCWLQDGPAARSADLLARIPGRGLSDLGARSPGERGSEGAITSRHRPTDRAHWDPDVGTRGCVSGERRKAALHTATATYTAGSMF